MIEKNIERILKEIKPYNTQLICVSKTRSDEEILEYLEKNGLNEIE